VWLTDKVVFGENDRCKIAEGCDTEQMIGVII